MGSRFRRARKNDELMLADVLRKYGIDVKGVRLLTPLDDGDDQCVVSFNSCVKEDVDLAREIIETEIGTVYDTVRIRDTHSHLIAFLE